MDDPTIRRMIEPELRRELAKYGYVSSEVRSGVDHDGDPVLFVTVDYGPGQQPVPGEATLKAIRAVQDKLATTGETRFPHLRHRYPDDDSNDSRVRDLSPSSNDR